MPEATYRYPDSGDRLTSCFVEHSEPFAGYWTVSEERMLARADATIRGGLRSTGHVRALDAGCGDGRLLGWISKLATHITALDPDPDRLGDAKRRWDRLRRDGEVPEHVEAAFHSSSIQDYTGQDFDLVVCSHVIQHVESTTKGKIIRRLRHVADPTAILMLTYSRSPVGQRHYSIDHINQALARVESAEVSEQQFDDAIRSGNLHGGLPVAHLDPELLRAQLADSGWTEFWNWTYHILDDLGVIDSCADRDEIVNTCRQLARQLGRDMVSLSRAS